MMSNINCIEAYMQKHFGAKKFHHEILESCLWFSSLGAESKLQ